MTPRHALLAMLAMCPATGSLAAQDASRQAALATINAEGITRDVGVLADDSLRGRPTPSRELDAAAAYVAAELRRAGVRPLAGHELVVRWPLVNTSPVLDGITLRVADGGRTTALRYGADFALMPGGPTPVTGRLVPVADLADTAMIRGRIPVLRLPAGAWSGPAHAAMNRARRGQSPRPGAGARLLAGDRPGGRRRRHDEPRDHRRPHHAGRPRDGGALCVAS